MTQLISRRAPRISPLFRTGSVRAAAILLLLAAALLLGSPAPQAQAQAQTQAQTEVWSATLTARDLGFSASGCSSGVLVAPCSNTSNLTDDDFTYDSTAYTVTAILVRSGGRLEIYFGPPLTTAAQTMTLHVAGTTFAFEDANFKAPESRRWNNSGLSWPAESQIALKLIAPVTTTNTAPTFTEGTSTTRSVAENTALAINIGNPVMATDADTSDTLTYTLGGTDAAAFGIVSTSGQLQTSAALDYETKSSYAVTVTVSDGNGGTDSIKVTITVTDVGDAPTQVEIWSATLTVGRIEPRGFLLAFGFAGGTGGGLSGGALSDVDFDHAGSSHTILVFMLEGQSQATRVLKFHFPNAGLDDVSDLTLHVGNRTFAFSDATVSVGLFQWQNPNLNWAESIGDTISVRITRTVPLPPSRWLSGGRVIWSSTMMPVLRYLVGEDINGKPWWAWEGRPEDPTFRYGSNHTVRAITYNATPDIELNPTRKLIFELAGDRGFGDLARLSLRIAGEGKSLRLHLADAFDFPGGTYWWWAREYGSVGALGWLKGGPVHVAIVEEDRPIRPANGLSFVPWPNLTHPSRHVANEGDVLRVCVEHDGGRASRRVDYELAYAGVARTREESDYGGKSTAATPGTDFTMVATVYPGAFLVEGVQAGRGCFRIQTVQDSDNEGTETFEIRIVRAINERPADYGPGKRPTATFTILDDDTTSLQGAILPEVTLSAAAESAAEGAALAFTLARTGPTEADLEVALEVSETGEMLAAYPSQAVIPAGAASAAFEVATADDATEESDSVVTVTIAEHAERYETGDPSSATVTVEEDDGSAAEPLTAEFEAVPESHDRESEFTFELRFSEEFPISYRTLRDDAFTVTGGTVNKAERLEKGSNIGWRVTVQPDGNGDVSIVLPVTTDCDARSAICAEDGRMLSHRLELTVGGP